VAELYKTIVTSMQFSHSDGSPKFLQSSEV